jgi:YHS domain-containing protein
MFRTLIYIIVSILLVTFVRSVIGLITKTMAELMNPSSPDSGNPSSGPTAGGELKKDPVCGTYVSATASVKKTIHGEVVHFCSAGCRDKYKSDA